MSAADHTASSGLRQHSKYIHITKKILSYSIYKDALHLDPCGGFCGSDQIPHPRIQHDGTHPYYKT